MFNSTIYIFRNKEDKEKIKSIHYEAFTDSFGYDHIHSNNNEISMKYVFCNRYHVLQGNNDITSFVKGRKIDKVYFYNILESEFNNREKEILYPIMVHGYDNSPLERIIFKTI